MSSQSEVEPGLIPSAAVERRELSRVVVILLNLCKELDTSACIESLRRSDHQDTHIVLVDNGSTDGSGEKLRQAFPDVTFIQVGENLGFTGGNNLAIRHALAEGCEYVLLLNNDTTVDSDCISHLVRTAECEPRVGAVGAKILYFDAPDRIWFAGGDISRAKLAGLHRSQGELDRPEAAESAEEVSFLTGCCMLLPARVLRELGGFREDFFAYIEDVELSLRMSAAGYRMLYQPGARVYHRVPLTREPIAPMKIVLRDRNRRRVARALLSSLERLRFAMYFYPSRLAIGIRYVLSGDRERAAAIWRGMTES